MDWRHLELNAWSDRPEREPSRRGVDPDARRGRLASTIARGTSRTIGDGKTRMASSPQIGHGNAGAASPIGRFTSTTPCRAQRYSYLVKVETRQMRRIGPAEVSLSS